MKVAGSVKLAKMVKVAETGKVDDIVEVAGEATPETEREKAEWHWKRAHHLLGKLVTTFTNTTTLW